MDDLAPKTGSPDVHLFQFSTSNLMLHLIILALSWEKYVARSLAEDLTFLNRQHPVSTAMYCWSAVKQARSGNGIYIKNKQGNVTIRNRNSG